MQIKANMDVVAKKRQGKVFNFNRDHDEVHVRFDNPDGSFQEDMLPIRKVKAAGIPSPFNKLTYDYTKADDTLPFALFLVEYWWAALGLAVGAFLLYGALAPSPVFAVSGLRFNGGGIPQFGGKENRFDLVMTATYKNAVQGVTRMQVTVYDDAGVAKAQLDCPLTDEKGAPLPAELLKTATKGQVSCIANVSTAEPRVELYDIALFDGAGNESKHVYDKLIVKPAAPKK